MLILEHRRDATVPIDDLIVEICHFGKVDAAASVVRGGGGLRNRAPDFAADLAEPGHGRDVRGSILRFGYRWIDVGVLHSEGHARSKAESSVENIDRPEQQHCLSALNWVQDFLICLVAMEAKLEASSRRITNDAPSSGLVIAMELV